MELVQKTFRTNLLTWMNIWGQVADRKVLRTPSFKPLVSVTGDLRRPGNWDLSNVE